MNGNVTQIKGDLVGLPPAGQVAYFTDASGNLKQVDSAGNVTSVSGAVANPDLSTVLVAPATRCDLTLNGNTAGMYWIQLFALSVFAGSQNIQLQVNGAATNLSSVGFDSLVGGAARTSWVIGNTAAYGFAASSQLFLQGMFATRIGRNRQINLGGRIVDANNGNMNLQGLFADTTSNITQLSIVAANANGLGTGTYLIATPLNTTA
jgi:hypothetical protein